MTANCLRGAVAALLVISGGAFSKTPERVSLSGVWPGHGAIFPGSLERGLGFSFVLGGVRVGPEIPSGWTITGGPGATLRLHHPSGLTVVRTAVVHPGSEAVEYAVRIKNDSRKDSAVLEDICALDVWFARQDAAATAVISSGGGMDDSKFPPRQYAIQRHELASAEVMLKTEGGRSSNLDLPFFFVQNDRAHEGLFVAIGWSGNWSASVCVAAHTHDLQLKGGIPGVQIRLKPGEEIGGPRIPRRRWPAPLRLVCRPHASVKNLGSIRTVPAALWT